MEIETSERRALLTLLDIAERQPRPAGFVARWRRQREIKRLLGLLQWQEYLADGRTTFLWRSPAFVPLFALAAAVMPAFVILMHADLSLVAKLVRLLALAAVGLGGAELFGRWAWRVMGREFGKQLARLGPLESPSASQLPPT